MTTFERALLKAKTIGVRNFRDKVSRFIHAHQVFIVTEHGSPTSILLPYEDVLEIVDILDELRDKESVKAIVQGRKAISRGVKGIPASKVFKNK